MVLKALCAIKDEQGVFSSLMYITMKRLLTCVFLFRTVTSEIYKKSPTC